MCVVITLKQTVKTNFTVTPPNFTSAIKITVYRTTEKFKSTLSKSYSKYQMLVINSKRILGCVGDCNPKINGMSPTNSNMT